MLWGINVQPLVLEEKSWTRFSESNIPLFTRQQFFLGDSSLAALASRWPVIYSSLVGLSAVRRCSGLCCLFVQHQHITEREPMLMYDTSKEPCKCSFVISYYWEFLLTPPPQDFLPVSWGVFEGRSGNLVIFLYPEIKVNPVLHKSL